MFVLAQDPRGGSHGYINIGYAAPFAPFGKGNVYHIAATYVRPSDWGGSFSFTECHLPATYIPSDYSCRSIPLFGGSGGPCASPEDVLKIYTLKAVREFRTDTPVLRAGVEAGPLFAATYKARYRPNDGSQLGTNYIVSHDEGRIFGLSLRVKGLVAISRVMGLEGGLFTHLNRFRSVVGGDLTLVLGLVRDRLE